MADISKINPDGGPGVYDIKDAVAREKLTVVDPTAGSGMITFGVDANGNYGYKKVGADTVTPFSGNEIEISNFITGDITKSYIQTISMFRKLENTEYTESFSTLTDNLYTGDKLLIILFSLVNIQPNEYTLVLYDNSPLATVSSRKFTSRYAGIWYVIVDELVCVNNFSSMVDYFKIRSIGYNNSILRFLPLISKL